MQNDQNKKRVILSYYGMAADPEGAVWIDPYTGSLINSVMVYVLREVK